MFLCNFATCHHPVTAGDLFPLLFGHNILKYFYLHAVVSNFCKQLCAEVVIFLLNKINGYL